MAYSAAAMFGGATFLNLFESVMPGGPSFSIAPGIAAFAGAVLLLLVGPRLPYAVLASMAPIGAAVIALAIADTEAAGDAAILYIWPVLWTAYFFGRVGAALIVVWVGIVHALALVTMPDSLGNIDRWLDVTVTVAVVAAVVEALSRRNSQLLGRLAEEARVDTLTGLLNRRGFQERIQIVLFHARRENSPVGVVSFDIDYFKRINDEWGHEAGDRVLTHLGEVFREESRATDVVARMGGEEFVAVLPLVEVGAARAYAERVRSAFSAPADADTPRATISAGVTAATAPSDIELLLQAADSALYAAKLAGRNRSIVEHPNGPPTSPPPAGGEAEPARPKLTAR